MPEGELRNLIRNELKTQIDGVWRIAENYHRIQQGDNDQGMIHCKTVESNLHKLIPDEKKGELRQIDLFLLSAAACLHDIGKVDARGWEDHGERSMQLILEHYRELGLDKGQAVAVALIASVHNHGYLDELPKTLAISNETINIIELAALFRLADILDTTFRRVPEIVRDIVYSDGNIPSKWRGRQSVTGWYLDEKKRIILQATPSKDDIDAVYTLWALMKEEISKISPYLEIFGYPHELGELELINITFEPELKKRASEQRPFPGMGFYTREDALIFKGRDHEIEELLSIVSAYPITLLIGESGAGKTSLIHAGLFPWLKAMSWEFIWTRPSNNPVEDIKNTIWNAFFKGKSGERLTLLEVMKCATEKCKHHKLLIVMDQFEDVLNSSDQRILDNLSQILMAVQTGTVMPNLRVLLSIREDKLVKLNSRLLKRITGSFRQFPSVELERLTREGAELALMAGLENANIGLDPRKEKGEKPLLEIILDEIQEGDRIYPPYIQIVAETLCKKVNRKNPVIAKEIYSELGGADNIIAHYLMDLLDGFGPQRSKVEKLLIFLISSAGEKVQKSLNNLSRDTEIKIDEIVEIIDMMIDLRLVRALDNDKFEIIHDCLGKTIDRELVREEDRIIKFLEEQLNLFCQNYEIYETPLTSTPFLALLYRRRKKIRINREKYPLILCTTLLGNQGLGWFWLRDVDRNEIFEMIKDHICHEMATVRKQAAAEFVKMASPSHKDKIFEMLYNDERYVQKAAAEAFLKVATFPDKSRIIEMMYHRNGYVRKAALEALGEIADPEDKEKIIEMLSDNGGYIRKAALEALGEIADPEDKEKIIEMLSDELWYVRKAALEALGEIADPEDKEKIIEMLSDKYRDVREAASRTFVRIVTPVNRAEIIGMLSDESWYVRKMALEALGEIADPEDKKKIMEMFCDEDEDVQRVARKAFLNMATTEDKEQIMEMFCDEDEDVRKAAVDAFLNMATTEDKERMNELLHHENWCARRAAIDAFLNMATTEDKEKIMEMFCDEDWYVRARALEALGKVADPEDKKKIMEMFCDEDWYVRARALEALGKVADPEDKKKIMEMFCDGGNLEEAMRSYGTTGFERSKIIGIFCDEYEDVRREAVKAFLRIATPGDREDLLDLLSDKAQGHSKQQINAFHLLSELDRTFYCPYI